MKRRHPRTTESTSLIALLLCCSVVGTAAWADEEPQERQAYFDRTQTYYLHVPRDYDHRRAWPLFIAVHGGMASGAGDFKIWAQYADAEGFILLAPNFTGEFYRLESGSGRRLERLVEELNSIYWIDRHKVLLSGFSWGGQFAYRFAMAHPEFAHTVAIFNSGNFSIPTRRPSGLARPRFYLAVGMEEQVYAQQAPGFVDMLKRYDYQADLYLARGVGHSIPSRAVVDVLNLFRTMKAEGASRER